jgi:hypothetical protein
MGKGRFVNQKLGKRVHRGVEQKVLKTRSQKIFRKGSARLPAEKKG